uniref:Uncharacterized protein n=1 Tax=Rhizophora mucronata TaxID=61149 RepID=A0A2P2QH43_RHIMU
MTAIQWSLGFEAC